MEGGDGLRCWQIFSRRSEEKSSITHLDMTINIYIHQYSQYSAISAKHVWHLLDGFKHMLYVYELLQQSIHSHYDIFLESTSPHLDALSLEPRLVGRSVPLAGPSGIYGAESMDSKCESPRQHPLWS